MTQFLCGKCKNMLPIALKPIGKSTWCKPCHKEYYNLQNFKCAYCGKDLEKYHVDHKIPICRGGCNDKSNLAISCPSCNLRKGRKTVEEFIGGYHR